jgi:hypothetical protein
VLIEGAENRAHASGAGLLLDPEAIAKHAQVGGVHPIVASTISGHA